MRLRWALLGAVFTTIALFAFNYGMNKLLLSAMEAGRDLSALEISLIKVFNITYSFRFLLVPVIFFAWIGLAKFVGVLRQEDLSF